MVLRLKQTALFTCALAALVAAAPTSAQVADQADDSVIVVTASKRGAANIQDIPYNISAVSGENLESAGIDDLNDFARVVPGLSVVDSGVNNKQIVIRGLAASGGSEQVSVYFDEVPTAGVGGVNVRQTDLRIYDIERIEVLRGPQGTLYGAGSQAGTIRYITNKPRSDRFEGSMDGGVGFRARDGGQRWSLDGMVNVPVAEDVLGIRAVGYYRNVDGIVDLPAIGLQDVNREETIGGRLQALLNLGSQTSLLLQAYYQDTDLADSGRSAVPDDQRSVVVIEPFKDKLHIYNATLEHKVDWGAFTATSSIFNRDTEFVFDATAFTGPATPSGVFQAGFVDAKSVEARFASDFSGPVQGLLGAFYLTRDIHTDSDARFVSTATGTPTGAAPWFANDIDGTFTNKALFGELTLQATKKLSFQAGARAFKLKRTTLNTLTATIFGQPLGPSPLQKSSFSDIIFKGLASYQAADDILAYALFSQGFREGGENEVLVVGAYPATFAPDQVDNFEIGLKTQVLDRQLTLNSAVYYMIWNDVQVQRIDASGAFGYVDNAGKAKLYGVEFEGSLRPRALPGFTADFSLRVSSQKLSVNNPNAETDPALGRKGDEIPNAIPLQASLGVQQGFEFIGRDAYARFDVTYTGKTHSAFNRFDPDYFAYGDYVMVNARVGIEDTNWNAALYVSNLFNVREVQSFTASYTEPWAFFSQPREVGVRLGFRF